jgi:tRNA pseudouridine55 synthase
MYSALKHRGVPLYRFARKGIEISRKPRQVEINKLDILESRGDKLTVDIGCSSGTYIRTLASDMGRRYGTGASLWGLRRTRIGDFDVAGAAGLEEIRQTAGRGSLPPLKRWMISLEDMFDSIKGIRIKDRHLNKIRNGSRISKDMLEGEKVSVDSLMQEAIFGELVPVRTSDGTLVAVHRLLPGASSEKHDEYFNKVFTKSIVIL